MFMRKDILKRKNEILNWINEHQSKAFICKNLNCKPETLNSYLKKMKINYSGNMGLKGIKRDTKRLPIEVLITKDWIGSHKLKLRLIEDGVKEEKCEKCNNFKWLDEKIPLELHHKDGNRYNNKLENLKLLCPNCHALEPNNSGAAKKKIPE